MFLLVESFKYRNVLILFLFSMKHPYLLILLGYFNTTLEEDKVIYPNGTSNYIAKDDFDGVSCSGHFFVSKVLKEI